MLVDFLSNTKIKIIVNNKERAGHNMNEARKDKGEEKNKLSKIAAKFAATTLAGQL